MNKYKYQNLLTLQTALPENYRDNTEFRSTLQVLQEEGFYGLELNIIDPDQADINDIRSFLKDFNLIFSMYASGLTAKKYGLSLSSVDEKIRRNSVSKCMEMIDFVAGTDIGIIAGFIKGGKCGDPEEAKERFKVSLSEIVPYLREKEAILIVEATNRHETSVANTVQDAVDLISPFFDDGVRVLPDTYHMNIEEADMFAAMKNNAKYYISFHISDNNRFFPGLGELDFENILKHLFDIGYSGPICIEGNIKNNFKEDLRKSINYLRKYFA